MKKLIFLLIGILLIGSLFVSAIESGMKEVPLEYINQNPVEPLSWWESFLKIFSREEFVPPVQYEDGIAVTTGTKFKSTTRTIYGESCEAGEYIEMFACNLPYSTATNAGCQRVFIKDWEMEYSTDYLDISKVCIKTPSDGIVNCRQRDWFTSFVNEKYVGYYCNVPFSSMDAQIISYNIPDSSIYEDTIKVTANIKFLADGKYYVEAGLRESSETMSVIDVSRALSQCDGSPQYDGKYVYVGEGYDTQAGNTKSYTFNFIDYGLVADYKVDLIVANGCAVGSNAVANYKAFDSKTEWISIKSGTVPVTEWACDVCRDDECKLVTFDKQCSKISEPLCTSDTDCAGIVECYCNICENEECKPKKFIGSYCPCNDACTSDTNCEGIIPPVPPPTDLAPTISYIGILSDLTKVRDGEQIKFKIEIKYPEGWELEEYANSIGAENTKDLFLEVGVYDKEWAEEQGYIKGMQNWWDRAWTVYKMEEPCVESESEFVSEYGFLLGRYMDKCDSDSEYYDEGSKACYTTFVEAYDQSKDTITSSPPKVDLTATIPTTGSLIGGNENTPNYNKDGKYWMIFGLYHNCGGYLPNEKSKYKLNITIKSGGGGNGNGETTATQLSMTEKDLKEATSSMIMQATCSLTDNCMPYTDIQGNTDYKVKCIQTPVLTSKIEAAAIDVCESKGWWKYVAGGGVAACGASIGIALAFPPAVALPGIICGISIPATIAVGGAEFAVNAGCKMRELEAAQGLCIAESTTKFSYCKYTEPLAFFEITGNECNDGMIILIGGIFSLVLISKLLGGGK